MSAVARSPYLQTVRTSSSYLAYDFGPALPARRRRLDVGRVLFRVVMVVAMLPLAGEVATGVLRLLCGAL